MVRRHHVPDGTVPAAQVRPSPVPYRETRTHVPPEITRNMCWWSGGRSGRRANPNEAHVPYPTGSRNVSDEPVRVQGGTVQAPATISQGITRVGGRHLQGQSYSAGPRASAPVRSQVRDVRITQRCGADHSAHGVLRDQRRSAGNGYRRRPAPCRLDPSTRVVPDMHRSRCRAVSARSRPASRARLSRHATPPILGTSSQCPCPGAS